MNPAEIAHNLSKAHECHVAAVEQWSFPHGFAHGVAADKCDYGTGVERFQCCCQRSAVEVAGCFSGNYEVMHIKV